MIPRRNITCFHSADPCWAISIANGHQLMYVVLPDQSFRCPSTAACEVGSRRLRMHVYTSRLAVAARSGPGVTDACVTVTTCFCCLSFNESSSEVFVAATTVQFIPKRLSHVTRVPAAPLYARCNAVTATSAAPKWRSHTHFGSWWPDTRHFGPPCGRRHAPGWPSPPRRIVTFCHRPTPRPVWYKLYSSMV